MTKVFLSKFKIYLFFLTFLNYWFYRLSHGCNDIICILVIFRLLKLSDFVHKV